MRSNSVSQSFKECQKQLFRLRKEVADLEAPLTPGGGGGSAPPSEEELERQLDELGATLAALLRAVGPGADMEVWKRKIQNAQHEQRLALSQLGDVCKRRSAARLEEEAQRTRYDVGGVVLDNEYKINASASASTTMVAQYVEMGRATVASLRSQRAVLENVQARLVDAGHAMGLSSSLMAVIQRRDFVDRLIVTGGMAVVVLVVILIWWFRR